MSTHGSRSGKMYYHSGGRRQILSDRKWELSHTSKTIEHSPNYKSTKHQRTKIKSYASSNNVMYYIEMKYQTNIILFELNTLGKSYKAYVDDCIIEKPDLVELFKFIDRYLDIACIDLLKLNIHSIDKKQHHIINTIKSIPSPRVVVVYQRFVPCGLHIMDEYRY
eukprot:169900_1